MSSQSPIEWTDATWSPLRAQVKADAGEIAAAKGYTSLVQIATKMAGRKGPHCEHVSDGCLNCYAGTNNARCLPSNGTGLPFDRRSRDLVRCFVDEKILEQPLHWRRPRKIFVENQSDLFGDWVTDEQIDRVFAVMAMCQRHTFQVLTKRPERMLYWATRTRGNHCVEALNVGTGLVISGSWIDPIENVWLGVSVENQETANARIPVLLKTPAAFRFVSYEPALGPVDFDAIPITVAPGFFGSPLTWHHRGACHKDEGIPYPTLDLVIIGGESGPGARPFEIAWARNTIEQCGAAGVLCFVKQLGANVCGEWAEFPLYDPDVNGYPIKDRKGGDMAEWPADLRVRQLPGGAA